MEGIVQELCTCLVIFFLSGCFCLASLAVLQLQNKRSSCYIKSCTAYYTVELCIIVENREGQRNANLHVHVLQLFARGCSRFGLSLFAENYGGHGSPTEHHF